MPSLSQKEKVIREKRTIEATKKNLMGISGKLGIIAQTLGFPIVRQGTGLVDAVYLDDPYDDVAEAEYETTVSGQPGPLMYEDEIKEASDDYVHEEGFVFDGLSRGMHIEIKYWHHNNKLEASYKGYQVYKEIAGELFAYAPFPEWEDMITRLYKVAKDKSKEQKALREAQIGQEIKAQKITFWHRLRTRWGL